MAFRPLRGRYDSELQAALAASLLTAPPAAVAAAPPAPPAPVPLATTAAPAAPTPPAPPSTTTAAPQRGRYNRELQAALAASLLSAPPAATAAAPSSLSSSSSSTLLTTLGPVPGGNSPRPWSGAASSSHFIGVYSRSSKSAPESFVFSLNARCLSFVDDSEAGPFESRDEAEAAFVRALRKAGGDPALWLRPGAPKLVPGSAAAKAVSETLPPSQAPAIRMPSKEKQKLPQPQLQPQAQPRAQMQALVQAQPQAWPVSSSSSSSPRFVSASGPVPGGNSPKPWTGAASCSHFVGVVAYSTQSAPKGFIFMLNARYLSFVSASQAGPFESLDEAEAAFVRALRKAGGDPALWLRPGAPRLAPGSAAAKAVGETMPQSQPIRGPGKEKQKQLSVPQARPQARPSSSSSSSSTRTLMSLGPVPSGNSPRPWSNAAASSHFIGVYSRSSKSAPESFVFSLNARCLSFVDDSEAGPFESRDEAEAAFVRALRKAGGDPALWLRPGAPKLVPGSAAAKAVSEILPPSQAPAIRMPSKEKQKLQQPHTQAPQPLPRPLQLMEPRAGGVFAEGETALAPYGRQVFTGRVVRLEGENVLVHYMGWADRYDAWLPATCLLKDSEHNRAFQRQQEQALVAPAPETRNTAKPAAAVRPRASSASVAVSMLAPGSRKRKESSGGDGLGGCRAQKDARVEAEGGSGSGDGAASEALRHEGYGDGSGSGLRIAAMAAAVAASAQAKAAAALVAAEREERALAPCPICCEDMGAAAAAAIAAASASGEHDAGDGDYESDEDEGAGGVITTRMPCCGGVLCLACIVRCVQLRATRKTCPLCQFGLDPVFMQALEARDRMYKRRAAEARQAALRALERRLKAGGAALVASEDEDEGEDEGEGEDHEAEPQAVDEGAAAASTGEGAAEAAAAATCWVEVETEGPPPPGPPMRGDVDEVDNEGDVFLALLSCEAQAQLAPSHASASPVSPAAASAEVPASPTRRAPLEDTIESDASLSPP